MRNLKGRLARLEQQIQASDADDRLTLDEWRALRTEGGPLFGLEGEAEDMAYDAYMLEHHPRSWSPIRERFLRTWELERQMQRDFSDDVFEQQEIR